MAGIDIRSIKNYVSRPAYLDAGKSNENGWSTGMTFFRNPTFDRIDRGETLKLSSIYEQRLRRSSFFRVTFESSDPASLRCSEISTFSTLERAIHTIFSLFSRVLLHLFFFFLSFVSRSFHPSDSAILALATPLGNSRMILQRRSRTAALIKRFALNVSIIPFPPLRSRDIDYIVPFLFS